MGVGGAKFTLFVENEQHHIDVGVGRGMDRLDPLPDLAGQYQAVLALGQPDALVEEHHAVRQRAHLGRRAELIEHLTIVAARFDPAESIEIQRCSDIVFEERAATKCCVWSRHLSLGVVIVGIIMGIGESWGEWDYMAAYLIGGPMFYPGRHQLALSGAFIMLLFIRELII